MVMGDFPAFFPALKCLFALFAAAAKHLVHIRAVVIRDSMWLPVA